MIVRIFHLQVDFLVTVSPEDKIIELVIVEPVDLHEDVVEAWLQREVLVHCAVFILPALCIQIFIFEINTFLVLREDYLDETDLIGVVSSDPSLIELRDSDVDIRGLGDIEFDHGKFSQIMKRFN